MQKKEFKNYYFNETNHIRLDKKNLLLAELVKVREQSATEAKKRLKLNIIKIEN